MKKNFKVIDAIRKISERIITWKCLKCNSIFVSDSREKMKTYCLCHKSSVKLKTNSMVQTGKVLVLDTLYLLSDDNLKRLEYV